MTPDVLLELVKGEAGTIALLILILTSLAAGYPFQPSYVVKDLKDENKRLDEVAGGSLKMTERILERTDLVLSNHEHLLENDQRILARLDAIQAEQSHAKDRESWQR